MKLFIKRFFVDLISAKGKFGRVKFMMGESYRIALLAACYGLYLLNLKVLAVILFPFALWVGVVATIKRFNDLELGSGYILLSLVVIGAGCGIAWQTMQWPYVFLGLGPYLLWVGLTPGKSTPRNSASGQATVA
ncbi:MAG: hypothetical protein ACRESG_01405 [Gammaproteobacteria bacterium]